MSYRPFALCLFAVHTFFGQQIQQFNDRYTLDNELSGQAVFQYYTSGNRMVKHGLFGFEHVETDSLRHPVQVKSIEFAGNYHHNTKTGIWVYKRRHYEISGLPSTADNEILYKATGNSYQTEATFREGKLHGSYQIHNKNIKTSQVTDSVFFLKVNFNNGIMQGALSGSADGLKVSGILNGEGMPNGVWEMTHRSEAGPIVERRVYDNGILRSLSFVVAGNRVAVPLVGIDTSHKQDGQVWRTLPAESDYFRMIEFALGQPDGTQELPQLKEWVHSSNTFLEKAFARTRNHRGEPVWQVLDGSQPGEPVQVLLREFPLTDDEKKTYQTAKNLLTEIESLTEHYLSDTQIEIGKHAHREIYSYTQAIALLRANTLKVSPLVRLLAHQAAVYFDREQVIQKRFPEIDYPKEVSYIYQDQRFSDTYDFPPPLHPSQAQVENMVEHLQKTLETVTQITEDTGRILRAYTAQSELQEREKELLVRRDEVVGLWSNKERREKYNDWHLQVSTATIIYAQKIFTDYAALSPAEKAQQIDAVFDCYQSLESLYRSLADLPRKRERIDELYTRTVWNPYTFTYMDERVKERVYRAYEQQVFPHVWNRLENNISCPNVEAQIENLEQLYRKMVTLREEDTRDLERQIRRSARLDQILEALNLSLN